MKVWELIGNGHYGGGMAIIAAKTEKEAKALGGKILDSIWNTNYLKPESIKALPLSYRGKARCITHFETGE